MNDLYDRLIALGHAPESYLLQDDSDGEGPYIRAWYGPGEEPTLEELEGAVIRAPVPHSLTPLQARRVLRTVPGLKETVDAYVASLPEDDREAWEYALSIERDHPVILAAIAGGIVTEQQADQLFILGATL